MESNLPTMHYHQELVKELNYPDYIPDELLFKWFNDRYSTSKHLLLLYSIGIGIKAKTIVEIGFGRSSFVLARVAAQNEGRLITCDTKNFSYLLNDREKKITEFIHGYSKLIWKKFKKESIDLAFLDYFSSESLSVRFVIQELLRCIWRTKKNGFILIHDACISRYKISRVIPLLKFLSLIFCGRRISEITLPYNYGLAIIKVGRLSLTDYSESWVKKEEP